MAKSLLHKELSSVSHQRSIQASLFINVQNQSLNYDVVHIAKVILMVTEEALV